jgi:hypothetical protein
MSNSLHFDATRCFNLLKKKETLRNQGIYIWKEPKGEYDELLSYKIILQQQLCYNRKDEYISLIEEFLKETAGKDGDRLAGRSGLFRWQFLILWRYMISDSEILEKEILEQGIQRLTSFYIDPKSREFGDLIEEIRDLCEFLTFDFEEIEEPEEIEEVEINPDEFRTSIEKIYFEIK